MSQLSSPGTTIAGRQVAILVENGFAHADAAKVLARLQAEDVTAHFVSSSLGEIQGDGGTVTATKTLATMPSVAFDAVYVPGGPTSVAALRDGAAALQFLREAYSHYKPLAATGEGTELVTTAIEQALAQRPASAEGDATAGVVSGTNATKLAEEFVAAIAKHRHWERDSTQQVATSVRP